MPAPALSTARLRLDNELRRLSPLAQRLGAVPIGRWRQAALVLLSAWMLANLARLIWLLLPLSTPPAATAPVPVNAASNAAMGARNPTTTTVAVDVDQLVGWHLFGEVGAVKPVAAGAIESQAQDTSLNLQLVGLVQSSDDAMARAILLLDGRQQQFVIGEQLPASGKVVLSKVLGDRAIIENNGRYETLWLYDQESLNKLGSTIQPDASLKSSAVDLRVDQGVTAAASGYREQLYQNPSGLADLIQVSVQQDGFRIRPGRDPQAFAAFGLRPDDVVTAINGVSLNNPESALNLYNQMRTAQEATLTIRRGGEEVVIAISLQGAAADAQP